MTPAFKNILAPFMIASFLMVAFFGFSIMVHGSDGRMQTDCPFTQTGASLCPQDALDMVVHHISAYQSLLSVAIDSGITVLMLAVSSIGIALTLFARLLPGSLPVSRGALYESPPLVSYRRKLTHWLSILENSPSSA